MKKIRSFIKSIMLFLFPYQEIKSAVIIIESPINGSAHVDMTPLEDDTRAGVSPIRIAKRTGEVQGRLPRLIEYKEQRREKYKWYSLPDVFQKEVHQKMQDKSPVEIFMDINMVYRLTATA